MNEKIKTSLRNAWNEPRRFFLGLTLVSIAVLGLGYVANINPSPSMESFGLICAAILAVTTVVGIAGFLLSWIPPIHRFFVWVLRRRFFLLACLATLIALFYAEENWRGKHAWGKYKREQEVKGEQFDLKSIAPPPVPDDQNFAMTTIWIEEISAQMGAEKAERWYGDKVAALGHTNFVRPLEMPVELGGRGLEFTNKSSGWPNAEKFDMKLWQEYYRKLAATTNFFPVAAQPQTPAADVLLALSKYDSAIEKLRTVSQLPYLRFPIGYTDDNPAGILLPHLSSLRGCMLNLQLRSCAELQDGHSEKALENIKLMLRLIEAIRNEPFVVSHLVCISMLQITLQPVWEGLAEHKWNDEQLVALDAELGKLDFLADYSFTMRGERTFGLGLIDYLRRHRDDIGYMHMGEQEREGDSEVTITFLLNRLIPGGWFDQNKISISQMHERYLLPIINTNIRVVSLSAHKHAYDACNVVGTKATPHNWFTRWLLPSLNNVSQKSARAQSSADLARVAIALERFRLANGAFPETLAALSPQFLSPIPHDIIDGKPPNYRRTPDDQFILYSIGWNGTDDGGSVVMGTGKIPSVDTKQGDWVWKYPEK